jgi:hypothetical protein
VDAYEYASLLECHLPGETKVLGENHVNLSSKNQYGLSLSPCSERLAINRLSHAWLS